MPASPIVLVVPVAAAANTYSATLTVTNSSTGCISNTYNFNVTVNTSATSTTTTITGVAAICKGNILALSTSSIVANASSYVWDYSWDGAGIDAASATNSINVDLSTAGPGIVPAGNYTIKVAGIRYICGCNVPVYPWSADFNLLINDIPNTTGSVNNTPNLCNNGTTDIVFNSTITATANWIVLNAGTTGATGGTGLAPGAHILQTLTNSGTEPVTVTYRLTPIGVAPTNCAGTSVDGNECGNTSSVQ